MLARILLFAQKLPQWLRPAFFGAAVLFIIVGLRMLFALPLILKQHKGGEFVLGLLAATGAGAAGGFGYTLLGAPSRRIPFLGPYIAGVISVGAYMLALLFAAPYISDEPLIEDRTSAIIFAVVTVFFGLVFGHAAFRDRH
jgi:hypothetical protein